MPLSVSGPGYGTGWSGPARRRARRRRIRPRSRPGEEPALVSMRLGCHDVHAGHGGRLEPHQSSIRVSGTATTKRPPQAERSSFAGFRPARFQGKITK